MEGERVKWEGGRERIGEGGWEEKGEWGKGSEGGGEGKGEGRR